jgi:hypothetical protein
VQTPLLVPGIAYRVGGVSFSMVSPSGVPLALDSELLDFETNDHICDVNIQVSLVERLEPPQTKPLFHSGGLWSLFAEPPGHRFSFLRPLPGETPYKQAWFNRQFTKGEVVLSRRFFPGIEPVYPLEYPLDELLMIHRLARGGGVELHALGVVDCQFGKRSRGLLFVGHSGAGKSTIARLWQKQPGVTILSDDRIVVRRNHGTSWMYGTPWHGDAGIASPDSARLDEIYFLEHAIATNSLASLRRSVAAAELFARSFVPRHCIDGVQFAVSFLDRVAREVPCQIFRFLPNHSAVEAIRHARARE